MVQHHAPGCRRETPWPDVRWWEEKAWSHFGAVPAFAEGGIHDSMGRWEWAPRGLGDPGAERRFRVEDAMHREPTRISKGGNHRVEKDGVPASFLSP